MRISPLLSFFAVSLMALTTLGCNSAPGRPKAGPEIPRPDQIQNFAKLYKQNCAACHGEDGRNGAAVSLNNPEYLALAGEDALLQITANGVSNTAMPPFARSKGGMLTDQQIHSLVDGMMKQWGKPGILAGQTPPAYAATSTGDAQQGQQVFTTFCARCHGVDGRALPSKNQELHMGAAHGSIVDPSYLALVSDQNLRTTTIIGLLSEGMPDWRGDVPSHPMTDKEITDVVAWLASQRTTYPGQPYPTPPRGQHPQ